MPLARAALLARFDTSRLKPISPDAVAARDGQRTAALVAACRLGTGAAPRRWPEMLLGSVRIEQPFACYQVDDAEAARRACLQLDGTWRMADASASGRVMIRAQALFTDLALWRAPQANDAWDAGEAADAPSLSGFEPRRHTLVLLTGDPGPEGHRALAALERRAPQWRRAVRVLLVGAPWGTARHLAL